MQQTRLLLLTNAAPGLNPEAMTAFACRHFDDFVNRKRSDVALKNFSTDFLDHHGPTGPASAQQMMEGAYWRWPDLHVEVLDTVCEGDKVVVLNQWTGTDAASGQKFEFRGCVLWRFAHGKIAERWATLAYPEEVA